MYKKDPKLSEKIKDSKFAVNASKFNHLGSRTGLSSALDVGKIGHEIEKLERNYGEGGYSFKLTNPDGTEFAGVKQTPLNFGGRLFYPNDKGVFKIIDEDYVNALYQREKEANDYLDSVMEKVLVSNYVLSLMLSPEALATADAGKFSPDEIKLMNPNSVQFSEAIYQLRQLVKSELPVLESMTTKREATEN